MDLWQIVVLLGIIAAILITAARYLYWQTRKAFRDELAELAQQAQDNNHTTHPVP